MLEENNSHIRTLKGATLSIIPSQPTISVVISARNEFPNIVHTVHSIINSLETDGYGFDPKTGTVDFEIIIADNGSIDQTTLFWGWAKSNETDTKLTPSPRGLAYNDVVRVIYDPVMGNVSARNYATMYARGKYLFFCDAHMNITAGVFGKMIKAIDESGGIAHAVVEWMGAYPPKGGFQYSVKVGEKFWGCVDEKTEILSKNGWKKYYELSKGDLIPTVSLSTKSIELQPVKDVTVWDYDGELVRLEGESVDILMTPDHRCIFQDKDTYWKIRKAEYVNGNKLPVATLGWKGSTSNYTDADVELLGWIITEGNIYNDDCKTRYFMKKLGLEKFYHYSTKRIQIKQKNTDRVNDIDGCLKRTRRRYHSYKDKEGCTVFKLGRKDSEYLSNLIPDKELTFELLFRLTKHQMGVLYETLMAGDGTVSGGYEVFYQKSRATTDAVQALITLMGYPSYSRVKKGESFKGNRFSDKDIFATSRKKTTLTSAYTKTSEKYKGKVWCPNVENGTIFIRRNGKVMPTGNTWNRLAVSTTEWFYIAGSGHCFLGVNRKQFMKFGGYNDYLRVYGGGELYLDLKWWLFGSCSVVVPTAMVYHLSAGRGYGYFSDDLIHNLMLSSYAIGGEKYSERVLLTYLNKVGVDYGKFYSLYEQALHEGKPDREFIMSNSVRTFDNLIFDNGECDGHCLPRAGAHHLTAWDIANEKKFGKHLSGLIVLEDWLGRLETDEAKNFIASSKYRHIDS